MTPAEREAVAFLTESERAGVNYMIPRSFIEPPRICSTCKHHSRPQWQTAGFGTCGHVVRLGLVKTVGAAMLTGASAGYVATHESFSCAGWTDPKAEGKR